MISTALAIIYNDGSMSIVPGDDVEYAERQRSLDDNSVPSRIARVTVTVHDELRGPRNFEAEDALHDARTRNAAR